MPGQRPVITETLIHTDRDRYPDWLELGKVGDRLHVAFSADRSEEAIDRIDEAMAILEYGRSALLARAEKEIKRMARK